MNSPIWSTLSLVAAVTALGCKVDTARLTVAAGVLHQATASLTASDSLNLEEAGLQGRASLTPASLVLNANAICLAEKLDTSELYPNVSGKEICIEFKKSVELIGQPAFTALAEEEEKKISEKKFGDYTVVKLQYDGIPLATSATPPGGQGFNSLPLKTRSTNLVSSLITKVKIDEKTEKTKPILSLYFDAAHAIYLEHTDDAAVAAGGTQVGSSDSYAFVGNLEFIPYIGKEQPILKKLKVRIDDIEDSELTYLNIRLLHDAAGQIVGGLWNPVYLSGFDNIGWQPCPLDGGSITVNPDSTYRLTSFTGNHCPEWKRLSFAALKLENHSGTLTYGSDEFSYTAALE
jgi:hypothetical protein